MAKRLPNADEAVAFFEELARAHAGAVCQSRIHHHVDLVRRSSRKVVETKPRRAFTALKATHIVTSEPLTCICPELSAVPLGRRTGTGTRLPTLIRRGTDDFAGNCERSNGRIL